MTGATQHVILWDMGKKRKCVTNVYVFMFKSLHSMLTSFDKACRTVCFAFTQGKLFLCSATPVPVYNNNSLALCYICYKATFLHLFNMFYSF